MTGKEFRDIRRSFALKKPDWMYALGYHGNKNTMFLNCDRYESGERMIPAYLAQYVWLLDLLRAGDEIPMDPVTGLPRFPTWPHYERAEVSQ